MFKNDASDIGFSEEKKQKTTCNCPFHSKRLMTEIIYKPSFC